MMATKQRDLFEIIHTHGRAAFFVVGASFVVGAVAVLFGHTFVVQIRHLKHIVVVQFLKMRHHGRLRCMKQFVAVNVQQPINAARAMLPRVVVAAAAAAAAAGGGGGGGGGGGYAAAAAAAAAVVVAMIFIAGTSLRCFCYRGGVCSYRGGVCSLNTTAFS